MDLKELTLLSFRNNWRIFRVLLWSQFLLLKASLSLAPSALSAR
ncbi:MAG: hypothetical protein AB7F86_15195 [Bdellovibrionales bacterium]